MYRSQGAMGEYFAAQGMGEYFSGTGKIPTAAEIGRPRHRRGQHGVGEYFSGTGEYFAGMGEYFAGTGGALVDWAKQEEAESAHKGLFGLGEYFSGMGDDDAAAVATIKNQRFMQWGLLAAVGLGGVSYLLKSKHPVMWAGAGVAGVAAAVYLYNVTG